MYSERLTFKEGKKRPSYDLWTFSFERWIKAKQITLALTLL